MVGTCPLPARHFKPSHLKVVKPLNIKQQQEENKKKNLGSNLFSAFAFELTVKSSAKL